jgi:hypothetical protein
MKRSAEIVRLGDEIRSRLDLLSAPSTAAVRAIRREFSHRIKNEPTESVIKLALHLIEENTGPDLCLMNQRRKSLGISMFELLQ